MWLTTHACPLCCWLDVPMWLITHPHVVTLLPAGQRGGAPAGGVWLRHRLHRAARGRAGQVRLGWAGPVTGCSMPSRYVAWLCWASLLWNSEGCAYAKLACFSGCSPTHQFTGPVTPAPVCHTSQSPLPPPIHFLKLFPPPTCSYYFVSPTYLFVTQPTAAAGPTARSSARCWAPRLPCLAAAAAARAACLRACSVRCWTSSTAARSTLGAWSWSELWRKSSQEPQQLPPGTSSCPGASPCCRQSGLRQPHSWRCAAAAAGAARVQPAPCAATCAATK